MTLLTAISIAALLLQALAIVFLYSKLSVIEKTGDIQRDQVEKMSELVVERLLKLQEGNEAKLEQMRVTVEEKLQGTLEKRLGESFKMVSDRLDLVHRGLGEMQTLASGVGDLKKVLTNVKTRGTWGEFQLAAILEQLLTPDQYAANVQVKKNSAEIVEFAIRLPGADDEKVWLPIDSKFPKEDYEKMIDASEAGNQELFLVSRDSLVKSLKKFARDIRDKYISPPNTTDFAILFLPTESLFAEILRIPGLNESLQREYRVTVAGPTTLAALLNSLQMGFRTLSIQKRSAEVWKLLGAVKTEFGKYHDLLDKVQKKLTEAQNTISETQSKTRNISSKLKKVEEMPSQDESLILDSVEVEEL